MEIITFAQEFYYNLKALVKVIGEQHTPAQMFKERKWDRKPQIQGFGKKSSWAFFSYNGVVTIISSHFFFENG